MSKLTTIIAPIEAGIVITIKRLNAIAVSINNGNLFKENNTNATTNDVIV